MSTIGAFTGKIKWYNETKGYGFIGQDGQTRDVFLHAGAIRRAGLDSSTFSEGDEVRFDLEDGPKGVKAVNISRI